MVLLQGNLLKYFIFAVRICDTFGNVPILWNKTAGKFQVKPPILLKINIFLFHLGILAAIIVIIQLAAFWKTASKVGLLFSLVVEFAYFVSFCCTFSAYKWPALLCSLLNSMISFENRWKFQIGKGNKIIGKIICAIALGTFMPVAYSLNVFILPCMPSYPGFWTLKQCKTESLDINFYLYHNHCDIIFKLLIAIFTFSGWCILVSGAMLQVCLILMQGYCFAKYARGFINAAQRHLKLNAYKEDSWVVQVYRELQIMVSVQHRQLNAKSVFLGVLLPGPCVQVIANYVLIEYLSGRFHIPIQMLILLVNIVFITFCTLFLAIGFLSMVYRESKDMQKELGKYVRNKGVKKFLKSCPVLKVSFGGSGNFFEPVTSLNVEQFSVDLTINLLLADI